MNTTTLRGVFAEPKPVHRRNFIKENVKQIKHMQGLLQEAGIIKSKPVRDNKYRNVPPILARSRDSTPHRTQYSVNSMSSQSAKFQNKQNIRQNTVNPQTDTKKQRKIDRISSMDGDQKFTNRAMQTEKTDNLDKLYETGVIKYASPCVTKTKSPRQSPQKLKGQGDVEELLPAINSLDLDDGKDYIRENMKNLKPKQLKQDSKNNSLQPPPTYQRGVVPKYLRERKEDDENKEEIVPECPPGHVLLPEEERKETLRVLRQSYADRIQELNAMPVRSDTLRMKKRKMELEEELKRIDGGIKVFQRPKVFVKINA